MKVKIMPENFVAFFTVCGFFVGLTFSVISIDGAFEIIVFTVLITFLFYNVVSFIGSSLLCVRYSK